MLLQIDKNHAIDLSFAQRPVVHPRTRGIGDSAKGIFLTKRRMVSRLAGMPWRRVVRDLA